MRYYAEHRFYVSIDPRARTCQNLGAAVVRSAATLISSSVARVPWGSEENVHFRVFKRSGMPFGRAGSGQSGMAAAARR